MILGGGSSVVVGCITALSGTQLRGGSRFYTSSPAGPTPTDFHIKSENCAICPGLEALPDAFPAEIIAEYRTPYITPLNEFTVFHLLIARSIGGCNVSNRHLCLDHLSPTFDKCNKVKPAS